MPLVTTEGKLPMDCASTPSYSLGSVFKDPLGVWEHNDGFRITMCVGGAAYGLFHISHALKTRIPVTTIAGVVTVLYSLSLVISRVTKAILSTITSNASVPFKIAKISFTFISSVALTMYISKLVGFASSLRNAFKLTFVAQGCAMGVFWNICVAYEIAMAIFGKPSLLATLPAKMIEKLV